MRPTLIRDVHERTMVTRKATSDQDAGLMPGEVTGFQGRKVSLARGFPQPEYAAFEGVKLQ